MKKEILKIQRMDCAFCAVNIENALKKEVGIKSANVHFASEKLYLEFDPIEISIARIIKIIEKLGYKASGEGLEEEMEDHRSRLVGTGNILLVHLGEVRRHTAIPFEP